MNRRYYVSHCGVRNSLHYIAPSSLGELVRAVVWRVLRATLGRLGGRT